MTRQDKLQIIEACNARIAVLAEGLSYEEMMVHAEIQGLMRERDRRYQEIEEMNKRAWDKWEEENPEMKGVFARP